MHHPPRVSAMGLKELRCGPRLLRVAWSANAQRTGPTGGRGALKELGCGPRLFRALARRADAQGTGPVMGAARVEGTVIV